jgi:phosphoribosyl 1,2-cyclic phosphodiesterase
VIGLTFYGVRGSTPCHGEHTARYGGNTSCIHVDIPGEPPLLFDLGTGLRYFGLRQPNDGSFRGNCLLTHLHWDHTQGLPFFTPLLRLGAELDVYGPVQEDGRSVEDVFSETVTPPMFPIPITALPGTVRFHDTEDADFFLGQVRVRSRIVPHVGPTLGYRISWQGRTIAYLPDHQQPYDGSLGITPGALELASGADLLIHDSQYTPEEFAVKNTWGHCTVEFALEVAIRAKVSNLVLFHHDPTRHDEAMDAQHHATVREAARHGITVITASEGLHLTIP